MGGTSWLRFGTEFPNPLLCLPPLSIKKEGKKKRKKLNLEVLNQRCFSKLCKIYCLGSTIVVPSLFFFLAVFLTHL